MNDLEKIDKLPAMTFEPKGEFESLEKSERKILKLCGGLVKVNALIAFNIGKELTLVKEKLKRGEFIPWLEEKFPFSRHTANRYMKFYMIVKTDGLSISNNLKLTEALREAGVIASKAENDSDAGDGKFDFMDMFERSVKPARTLKNHRVIADLLDEIIVVSTDKDNRLISKTFSRFFEDIPKHDPELLAEYKKMADGVKAAIEEYLAIVEQEERQR